MRYLLFVTNCQTFAKYYISIRAFFSSVIPSFCIFSLEKHKYDYLYIFFIVVYGFDSQKNIY